MKPFLLRLGVILFIIGVLFLNKEDGNHLYGWSINVFFFFIFFLDWRNIKDFDFKTNVYGVRMLMLCLLFFVSLLWAPWKSTMLYVNSILIMVINSFVLYYFLTKYDYFKYLIYIILIYSFINYSIALNIPTFSFLKNAEIQPLMGSRFLGTEYNPNFLAITLIYSLLISLLSFYNSIKQSKYLTIVHIVNIILGVYTIFLTESRKGIVFSCMLIALFFILNYKLWFHSFKKYLVYIFFTFVFVSFLNIDVIFENLEPSIARFNRMISSAEGGDNEGSTVARINLIKYGWEGFTQSPWIGHGSNSFIFKYGLYAHNNYIELLYSLGILGAIVFYSIHFSLFRKLYTNRKGWFLISFLIILMLMDFGFVSFREKRVMMMFITIIIYSNKLTNDSEEGVFNSKV